MSDRLSDLFSEAHEECTFSPFREIRDTPYNSEELCGMIKLYELTGGKLEIYASHEQITLAYADDLLEPMTKENIVYLAKCGVYIDGDRFFIYT